MENYQSYTNIFNQVVFNTEDEEILDFVKLFLHRNNVNNKLRTQSLPGAQHLLVV